MKYENIMATENTMPLDNIVPVQNVMPMQQNIMKTRSYNEHMKITNQLAQACFAVTEAVLYLDTHPNDQNALEYYRKKQQQLMEARSLYEKNIGPINPSSVDTNSSYWQWVETPWPWQLEEA